MAEITLFLNHSCLILFFVGKSRRVWSKRMKISLLKIFFLCTLLFAMESLVVMLYYSVTVVNYAKIVIKYTGMSMDGITDIKGLTKESNSSRHEDNTIEIHRSVELEMNKTEFRNKNNNLTDVVTQLVKTRRNNQGENKPTVASENHQVKELCPSGSKQVGPLYVDKSVPKEEDLDKKMSIDFNGLVKKGGSWKPTECQARVKMALIVPYRNRYEQLLIFVRHMHPMLKRQNLEYRIFVIEQAGDTIFNRAILFNIGFKEALKFDQYECFIFHDVDLISENDFNEYSCPSSPRHMSVAVDKFGYSLPYDTIFGGVGSFSKQHFELINGFSNKFWGWGGEDDDLYIRISAKGLKLTRPSMQLGRYTMIQVAHRSAPDDEERFDKLRDSAERMGSDGLNSLKYTVMNITEHLLYTLVTVDVKDAVGNKR